MVTTATEKKRRGKKSRINYRTNQNIRITITVFLRSQLSASSPHCDSQPTSASLGGPPVPLGSDADVWTCCRDRSDFNADVWTCCRDRSDFNLALLLSALASHVHSCQREGVFFCGNTHSPPIYPTDSVYVVDPVSLTSSLYSWWKGFQTSSSATPPVGLSCGFIPTSGRVTHRSLLLRQPWRMWARFREDQVRRRSSCSDRKGPHGTRCAGKPAAGRARGLHCYGFWQLLATLPG